MSHIQRLCVLTFTFLTLSLAISLQAQTATHPKPFDFDGDGKTDLTVWRPSDGTSGKARPTRRASRRLAQSSLASARTRSSPVIIQFMISDGGTAYVRKTSENQTVELGSFPFSKVTMAYIRIRFKPDAAFPSQSKIYFETSPTGADGTWTVRNSNGSNFNDFALNNVKVSLNAGTFQSGPGTKQTVFDDFKFARYGTAVANAGEDKSLTLGGTVSLDGAASSSYGGTITAYKWTLMSKPNGAPDPTITSPTGTSTGITGLTFVGYYNFQLTVTDSFNNSSTDAVRLYIAEPPFARISAPAATMEDEPIVFDGSLSSGGYEFEWDFGDGRKAEIARATHLYMIPGTYTITLKVTNEAGATAPLYQAAIATLQVTINPLPAATNPIPHPSNLQSAINSASGFCGRTDIVLAHGVDYGSVILPSRTANCDGYVRIMSDSLNNLPAKGVRISEDNVADMPRISTSEQAPAMKTNAAAHHYHFLGILFKRALSYTGRLYDIVELTDPSSSPQLLQNMPHHFIFDRCIFSNVALGDNNPPNTAHIRRGMSLNTGSASVINSYFKEIKADEEAKGINCWTGTGPHAIINNFIEAGGQSVLYGGDAVKIAYLTPTDITIRGNYMFKPLRWATENFPCIPEPGCSCGGPLPACDVHGISVKNIFELKHARNVIFDGNVMQNSFPRGQFGDAIVIQVGNETYTGSVNTGGNPWVSVRNVQISNNKIDNIGLGINIKGLTIDVPSVAARNLIIRNNLFDRVGETNSSSGEFIQVAFFPGKFWVTHNTVFQNSHIIKGYGFPLFTHDSEFRFDNNILQHNIGGFSTDGNDGDGLRFLGTYAPGWQMRRNVLVFPQQKADEINNYPFPVDVNNPPSCPVPLADLKLNKYFGTALGTFSSLFVDRTRGDLRLSQVTYGGRNWATDCTDVGVSLNPLQEATAGSRAGLWPLNNGSMLLADDFNDSARDTFVWAQGTIYGNSSSVTVTEQNNRLEITSPSGSGEQWSGYDSIYPLNFEGAQAAVEVPQVVSNEGGETWIFVYQDTSSFFRFGVRCESGGSFTLQADKISGGSYQNIVSVTYAGVTSGHRWWRIRHQTSNNTMWFETSPDGLNWTAQGSVSNHLTTANLKVSVGAAKTTSSASSPSTAGFNNLKVNR